MPTIHAWQSCIDLKSIPADQRADTAETLNWLEAHVPEFNDMVYNLRQCQKAYQLEKIKARADMEAEAVIDYLRQSYYEAQLHKDADAETAKRR